MKDEIKEILESLDKIAKGSYYPEDLLYYENCKQLLDYITNLEEKYDCMYDKLTSESTEWESKCYKLQEENEQLRTDMNTYNNTVKEVNKECNSLFNHLTKKDLDYKSRNEKALEYIWSTKYEWGDLEEDNEDFDIDIYKLLKILQGEDKDE